MTKQEREHRPVSKQETAAQPHNSEKKCSIPEPTGIIQKRSEMRHRRASNIRHAPPGDTRDGERNETRQEH